MRTAKDILRHELIGLRCEVVDSRNRSQIGIQGRIEDETMKTVVINGKRIFKRGTKFRIYLDSKEIDVDGKFLLSRPEDRIKKKIKKW